VYYTNRCRYAVVKTAYDNPFPITCTTLFRMELSEKYFQLVLKKECLSNKLLWNSSKPKPYLYVIYKICHNNAVNQTFNRHWTCL